MVVAKKGSVYLFNSLPPGDYWLYKQYAKVMKDRWQSDFKTQYFDSDLRR